MESKKSRPLNFENSRQNFKFFAYPLSFCEASRLFAEKNHKMEYIYYTGRKKIIDMIFYMDIQRPENPLYPELCSLFNG